LFHRALLSVRHKCARDDDECHARKCHETGQGVADRLVMGGHDLSGDSLEDSEVTGHGVEPPPLPAGYFLHDVSFFKFAQQAASSRGADVQPFLYTLYGLYWRGIEQL